MSTMKNKLLYIYRLKESSAYPLALIAVRSIYSHLH